jgi:uncharacterized membrane protein YgdD (TMEM256/DUF423 family)
MRLHATGALLAAIAVGLGAFGAHGLKEHFQSQPTAREWWETASQYLLVHAAVAALLPLYARTAQSCMILGALVFSSTLYAMALGAPRWLGAITPIGGVLLLVGWLSFAWATLRTPQSKA